MKFNSDKTIFGSEKHLIRLGTLLRFAIKWSLGVGIIAFPIILIIGFFILNQKNTQIEWIIPWVIYGIASSLVFINSMLLSFIEGCDSVGDVQRIRFYISFVTVLSTVVLLVFGTELYALVLSLFVGAITGIVLIFIKYHKMLRQLYDIGLKVFYDWKVEILKLIGKYSVSWISGYFIFYIFTPIAFTYKGIVESGQIGLTIAVFTAIFGISNIWMTIIIPKINMLVSKRDYETLDQIFKKHLLLSIVTYILGVITLFIIVLFLKDYVPFDERLVSPFSLMIISIVWLLQIIVQGLAYYMRAHKEEPLVIPSFVSAIYVSLTTLFIAIYLPFEYFFLGFLSSYIWGIPWILIIFKKYKGGNRWK